MESECSVPHSQQLAKFQALKYGDVTSDFSSPKPEEPRASSRLSSTAYSAFTAADKSEGSQLKTAMSGWQWTQWTWGHDMVEDCPYGNNRAPTGHACW